MSHRSNAAPVDRLDERFGDRLADRIAAFGGSWTFITIFLLGLAGWAVLNTEILGRRHEAFDPYPYVFLNLMLSMLAALQAPVILMAQNREARRDRARAESDFHVNVLAEAEIRVLHEKVDTLREQQWRELVEMQRVQIAHLQQLVANLALADAPRSHRGE